MSARLQLPLMRHRLLPVLVVGALGLVLVAMPAIGLAGNGPKGGPAKLQLGPGAAVATPSQVAGASMGAVGSGDAVVFSTSAGGTIVATSANSAYLYYNSTGADVVVPLGLPSGAKLWQVDVYGNTSGATSQSWALVDEDPTNGDAISTLGTATTATGPGVVHATMSFPSGLTLATGHEWQVDLYPTSASSGFVGAVFQYTLPTVSLVPISPTRVYDSRCTDGVLAGGSNRTISVATGIDSSTCAAGPSNVVPAGARAVAYNLTVAATTAAGWVALVPHGASFSGTSSINWFGAGQVLANGGVVSLGGDRQLDAYAGGTVGASTYVIVDITGYYR